MNCAPIPIEIVSANDIRPKFWVIAVGMLNVVLPFFVALGLYIDPEVCLLGADYAGPGTELRDEVGTAFRDAARGMAAGLLLAILVAYVAISTRNQAKLREANFLLLSYFAILIIDELIRGFVDALWAPRVLVVHLISLMLQIYMLRLLRKYKTDADDSTLLSDKDMEDFL